MSGSDKGKILQLTRYTPEFASDWLFAIRSARSANDSDGLEGLIHLVLDFFEEELPELDQEQLIQYLESCPVWRKFNVWPSMHLAWHSPRPFMAKGRK
jgi:hypothetical protein